MKYVGFLARFRKGDQFKTSIGDTIEIVRIYKNSYKCKHSRLTYRTYPKTFFRYSVIVKDFIKTGRTFQPRRKIDVNAFIKAAKIVSEELECCGWAIEGQDVYKRREVKYFNRLMNQKVPKNYSSYEDCYYIGELNKENQLVRSLVLLLTAEVLKDERING